MWRVVTLLLLLAPLYAQGTILPPFVLQWPSSSSDLLVAETDAAVLHHYRRDGDGGLAHEKIYMSVGLNGVGKQREWDQKTPLGVYVVTSELDTSRLHQKYGVNAFPLDYPNARDRQLGRTGSGIWLHGVLPGGERRPERDTDGCLAIPNEDLLALSPRIVPGDTAVVITRQLTVADNASSSEARDELLSLLETWRAAIQRGDLRALRSLYSDDFSYAGLDRDTWLASRINDDIEQASIDYAEVLLVADPVEAGLYLSRFEFSTKKGPQSRALIKRLYWQRGDNGFRVVAEDSY
ncbi:MAG: L,D-transpeptidase family protein [Pseudomonadota bacterium]